MKMTWAPNAKNYGGIWSIRSRHKTYFEVNPEHPLVKKLDKESDEELFEDVITVLFGQARLAEGEYR